MSTNEEHLAISEVAARTGLEPDTLRYFERAGVLPAPGRDAAGRRRYTDADVELVGMLVHLRDAGMPLSDIAAFTRSPAESADALRLELLRAHRRRIDERRRALDRALEVIQRKIGGYPDQVDGCPQLLVRPDTTIAYDVRGRGPLLFLVGAPAGRSGFAALAAELAGRFTVVTHDPRGIGASHPTPGMAPPTPAVLARDLAALVDVLTGEPASFAGTSGGAVTLLELAARHPGLLDTAVLHEPPLVTLLDDAALAARAAAAFAVADADPQRAAEEFLALSGAAHRTGAGEPAPPEVTLPPLPPAELEKNRYFLGRMAGPTVFYVPDVAAASRVRLTVCAGSLSHHQLARRAAQALADLLHRPLVDLPGNHLSASTEPVEFAQALVPLLRRP